MEEYFINELALATAAAEIPDEVRHRMLEQGYCTDAIIGYMILGMKKMGFSYLNTQKAIEGVKAALKENTAVEAEQTSLREFFQDLDVDLVTIKDLGLPEQLESQLLDFVDYSKKSKFGMPNLLLVGCPLRTLPRLLKAIASEMGIKLKLVDGRSPLPPSELSEMLDNLSSNDGVYLAHIEKLKPESLHIFEQILFANEVEFFNNILDLSKPVTQGVKYYSPFSTIVSVENMDQVPKNFERAFCKVVDFTKKTLRPPTDEEVKEMLKGILQENRDSMTRPVFPKKVICNNCTHRIPATIKCSLLYPNGIPTDILSSRVECKEFNQK